MFASFAKFQLLRARRQQTPDFGSMNFEPTTWANDNRTAARQDTAPRKRPRLVCRWSAVAGTNRLACRWQPDSVHGTDDWGRDDPRPGARCHKSFFGLSTKGSLLIGDSRLNDRPTWIGKSCCAGPASILSNRLNAEFQREPPR